MRLEPVFLVAPKSKPPSMPTRRAFLLAGGMFTMGLGLGGACGYAAGVSGVGADGGGGGRGGEEKPNSAPALPPSSGDAELDNLRRLALVAPIEELVGEWLYFADVFATDYRTDPYLVTGIERLVEHVLTNEGLKDRKTLGAFLSQVIERGEEPIRTKLGDRVAPLRMIR